MADQVRPYHKSENLVWDSGTLSWVAMTQPGAVSAGGDGAILDGVSATIKATVLDLVNSNPLTVAVTDAAGSQITSFGGGTQYTEDIAAAADPIGTMQMAVRADTPAATVSTDGDNIAVRATNKGEQYVKHIDSIPVTDNAGSLTVDAPVATPVFVRLSDGAAAIATLPTNVAQLAGTATSVNSGVKDAGTLRVVLATDQPQLTNKLLVTPDSVALPANQSVNVNQFGGSAVVTGAGVAGSGIPRVTVSGDDVKSGAVAFNAAGVTASISVSGMSGAGGVIRAGTLTVASTIVFEVSYDSGSSWSTGFAVVGSGQATSVTPSGAEQAFNFLLGEGTTNVRARLSVYEGGGKTSNVEIVGTKIVSPLSVGALPVNLIGLAPPLWGTQIAGTDGSALRAAWVKPASTPSAATDQALVTDIRPGGVLPASAAAADGLANPTISQLGADNMLFNGTTWDRQRGNWNTTTGDSGSKTTSSFLGAAQTNYNARGAIITCLLGTVTGAVTTWQTAIQWSFDGGTTWLALTPLGANDTAAASGRTYTWIIYPTNTSQAAGGTPANLAPGTLSVAAPTQLNVINAALPRTWRFAASINVATSIVITSVNVNYLV
jgi:hypothetical protein